MFFIFIEAVKTEGKVPTIGVFRAEQAGMSAAYFPVVGKFVPMVGSFISPCRLRGAGKSCRWRHTFGTMLSEAKVDRE
jgi:hypothetical protein